MNQATIALEGFICPVRGCKKRKNRRFSLIGLMMHFRSEHPGELEKRLNLRWEKR